MTNTDLADLIGSRICHDLISPIGAIGNGLELWSLIDGESSAEMDLIRDSVENANARIRYFRIAYGAASAEQMIGRSEVISILTAMSNGGRFTYDWRLATDMPRHLVRCAFLMLQCIETAMPMGGNIVINCEEKRWSFVAEGRRVVVDEALWSPLTSTSRPVTHNASQVQFALLPTILAKTGKHVEVDVEETVLRTYF